MDLRPPHLRSVRAGKFLGLLLLTGVLVAAGRAGFREISEKMKEGDAFFRAQDFQSARASYAAALKLVPNLEDGQKDRHSEELQQLRYKAAATAARTRQLRVGEISYPETYDSITATKPVEKRLSQLVFHALVTLNEREQWVGVLARKWKAAANRLSYTFELRRDIRWPNGRPVTAQDVDFTISLLKNPDTFNYDPFLASFFERTTVHDPFKITIYLTRQFFEPLSLLSFKILPAYAFGIPLQLRDIVSDWQVKGDLYTFKLRPDIQWPNGSRIQGADIEHTLKRRTALPRRKKENIYAALQLAGNNGSSFQLRALNQTVSLQGILALEIVPRYALDAPLRIGDLAVRTEDLGNHKYRLQMRGDVAWPAGQKVTASDVVRVLNLIRAGRLTALVASRFVTRCHSDSPQSITVETSEALKPDSKLYKVVVRPPRHLLSAALTRAHWFRRSPLGSGPFARNPAADKGDSEKVFERNQGYFLARTPPAPSYLNHRPFLRRVSVKVFHDRSAARRALEDDSNKESSIDVSVELRPLDIEFFSNLPENYYLRRFKLWKVHFLAFNFRKPIFQNKDFRLAVCYALDRKAILEKIFRGGRGGQPHVLLTGPYPKGSWAYDYGVEDYEYKPDRARELLAKSGISNPSFSLKFPSYDRNIERACSNMQETLADMGIRVRLERKLERDLHDEVLNQHDFDMVYYTHTFDETLNLAPLLDSSRTGKGGSNFGGYKNELLMERFRELNARPNADRIQAITHEIHETCHREAVLVSLWQLDIWSAFRKTVKEEQVSIHPFLFYANPQDWTVR